MIGPHPYHYPNNCDEFELHKFAHMNNQVLIDLEIERLSCLLCANEMRKNDGIHMGGKNVREIIEMMEERAVSMKDKIEQMLEQLR